MNDPYPKFHMQDQDASSSSDEELERLKASVFEAKELKASKKATV